HRDKISAFISGNIEMIELLNSIKNYSSDKSFLRGKEQSFQEICNFIKLIEWDVSIANDVLSAEKYKLDDSILTKSKFRHIKNMELLREIINNLKPIEHNYYSKEKLQERHFLNSSNNINNLMTMNRN